MDYNRRVTPRARLLLCLVTVAAVAGSLAFLWSRPIADIRDRPLAPDDRGFAGVPIEPTLVTTSTGDREVRWPLVFAGATDWIWSADEISVAFATFLTSPTLRSLTLESPDGRCRYEAPAGAALINNAATPMRRTGPCPTSGSDARWTLTLRIGPEGRVAFWAYDVAVTDPVPAGLAIEATRTADRFHVLRGRVRTWHSTATLTRAALLAYAWTGRTSATWVWLLLAGLSLTAVVGLWAVTSDHGPAVVSAGAGAVALAGALLWAVAVPPLQGADEPDHLLSYAEVTGRQGLEPNLRALAQLTHFERIRFHGDERLRPMDIGAPHPVAWTGDIHAERMDRRSPLAVVVWRVASAVIGADGASAAGLLIRLRAFDALIFSAAVAVMSLVVVAGGRSRWPLLGLAVVPTLPYFATAFSDWALVASGAVLLAGAVIASQDDRGSDWARGALLGGAISWLLSASMSALALGPLIGATALARLTAGPTRTRDGSATLHFWGALALGLLPGLFLTSDVWTAGYARFDQEDGSGLTLLSTINAVVGTLARAPWLLLVVPVGLGAAEWGVRRLTQTPTGAAVRRTCGRAATVFVFGAAAVILLVLASSLVVTWPSLTPMEIAPVASVRAYTRETVAVFLTSWRLAAHDHLMFTSFWSGFGWIDAIVPTWLLGLMAAGTAAGFALGSVAAGRESSRRAWFFALHTGGIIASVAALAVAGAMMERNVHGRYLIGVYTPLVLIAWSGWGGAGRLTGRFAPWVVAAVVAVVQIVAFGTILTRYF